MTRPATFSGSPPGPPTPPALASLGIVRTVWKPGHSGLRWAVPEERRLTNTAGHLHGGYLCVMADALLGSALSTVLGPEQRAVNPDFHCHFLERAELGALLEGEGRLVHRGRSVSFLEATLRDARSGATVLAAHSIGLVLDAATRSSGTAGSDAADAGEDPPEATATQPPVLAQAVLREAAPASDTPSWNLPPWLEDFGARFTIRENGRCGLTWPIAPGRFENRAGSIQGGYLCLVADAAMGFALIHGVPGAWAMATTTLSMHLLRPASAGTTLDVEAWVERRGRRFGFMACEVRAGERLLALGRASGLLRFRDAP
ncbi:MAG TPA: PaaI family thioesterase [Thermoanaerobaculia bacterium]|nr:PaaI family thioesterase [Thermoanaerobaculia bacterium]